MDTSKNVCENCGKKLFISHEPIYEFNEKLSCFVCERKVIKTFIVRFPIILKGDARFFKFPILN